MADHLGLTAHEVDMISDNIGQDVAILGSIVARLLVCNPAPTAHPNDPNGAHKRFPGIRKGRWMDTGLKGPLIFAFDRPSNTYYFMMFRVNNKNARLMFEYELYFDLEFKDLDENFCAFEMDDLMAGFQFSSPKQAKAFFIKVKMMAPKSSGTSAMSLMDKSTLNRRIKRSASDGTSIAGERDPGQNLWNADGTVNLKAMPSSWKKLLKKAGFKKKDMSDPGMRTLIVACLEDVGISAQPPPELTQEQVQQYYSPEDAAKYEQYRRDLKNYEHAMAQYEREIAEYDAWQREQNGLNAWEEEMADKRKKDRIIKQQQERKKQVKQQRRQKEHKDSQSSQSSSGYSGNSGASRPGGSGRAPPTAPPRSGSVSSNGSSMSNKIPPPMPPRSKKAAPKKPKVSRATVKPLPPPLPRIRDLEDSPHQNQGISPMLRGLADAANSDVGRTTKALPGPKRLSLKNMLMQGVKLRPPSFKNDRSDAGAVNDRPKSRMFLANITDGKAGLKKTELPDVNSLKPDQEDSLLAKLKSRLQERRAVVQDDSDDDDDWAA